MADTSELIRAIAAQMGGGGGGAAGPGDQLKALMASITGGGAMRPSPEMNQGLGIGKGRFNAGKNTGGRHDPRMGSVYRGDGQERMVSPPSRGRDMSEEQVDQDTAAMDEVNDAIGGTDVSNLGDPGAILQAAASGDPGAIKQLILAAQSGALPTDDPALNKLIDKMKRGGVMNKSNIAQ